MSKTKRIPADIAIKKLVVAKEIDAVDLQNQAIQELALQPERYIALASLKVRKEVEKASRKNKMKELIARYKKEIQYTC